MRRLAIRPGGIGDSILGFPALEHLAVDSELEVWARAEVLPLLPFKTASIDGTGIGLLGIAQPPGELVARLRGFDEIHTWYGAARDDFREALGRIHTRVHYYDALPTGAGHHAADFFSAQVGAPTPAVPRIEVHPTRHRLIVIHPYSGGARKNWGIDRYQLLARWLEATGRPVCFCVAPHQRLPGARIIADLRELGSFLAGASLYIGNDSGVTHLAAACGANIVALFGASDAGVWSPRGERVRVLDSGSLDALSPERVLDAALAQTGFLQD